MIPQVEYGSYYRIDDDIIPAESIHDVEHEGPLPEVRQGWLYRMSESGTMDITDWCVAETEAAAYRELVHDYGNSEGEPEEWQDEACGKAGICPNCWEKVPDNVNHDGFCCHGCYIKRVNANGPEDGDWVTADYREFRAHEGKAVCNVFPGHHWLIQIQERMNQDGYWPNVWYIGERGDWNLLDLETGEFAG